jgi:predicted dehydrogenase
MLPMDDRIIVGYVLRYTEVAQLLKKIVAEEGCLQLNLDYSSHTVTDKTKGWRSESSSGLLEEVGCHMLDLMNYILSPKKVDIVTLKGERYFSKGYDMLEGQFTADKCLFNLSLNWSDPKRRKPYWHGVLKTKERTINFDQQKIDIPFDTKSVNYYVRGREFSNQMLHFLSDDVSIGSSSQSSNSVHELIQRINKIK